MTAADQHPMIGTSSRPAHRARRLGIVTGDDVVVFMRADCEVCRSEGLSSRSRVLVTAQDRSVVATLYQLSSDLLEINEAGLSESAWDLLGVSEGDPLLLRHPEPLASFAHVRSRMFGHRLGEDQYRAILEDVVGRRYSLVETTAHLVSESMFPLDQAETVALTRAMAGLGDTISWPGSRIVADKHCVGGLPGNRTTPIVVAIAAALGLTMPKTSSRAITSPAGTADAMETLAPVDLDMATIRRVVESEGGCVAWGGAVRLSPADDLLIQVERVLDIDAEGQLVASVLSKKIAAGATHLVLDIPVGPTAKVRTSEMGQDLAGRLASVAHTFGLATRVVFSDGRQPVGRGIGPALEARDVLAVLQQASGYPEDLRDRACALAGALLELTGTASAGEGVGVAASALVDGRAWAKFQRICEAQGGMRVPPVASQRSPVVATRPGIVTAIDNGRIARVAKLAGAPAAKAAGVEIHVRLGDAVAEGQPLFSVHGETAGELEYSLDYVAAKPGIVSIGEPDAAL